MKLVGLEAGVTVCWPGRGMAGRGSRREVRQSRTAWGSLVEGGRARCFRQTGGRRQTEADGVLGGSRRCVKGSMVDAAWTVHGFCVVVKGRR